jgi:hypothetical protein
MNLNRLNLVGDRKKQHRPVATEGRHSSWFEMNTARSTFHRKTHCRLELLQDKMQLK